MTLPRDTQETGCDNTVTLRNSAYFVAFQLCYVAVTDDFMSHLQCKQTRQLLHFLNKISCHTSVITFVYYETKENERYGLQITDR